MSEYVKKYNDIKSQQDPNSVKICLFRLGNFYEFFGEDAKIISELLDLRITNFSKDTVKCGFPVVALPKYYKILDDLGFELEIYTKRNDEIEKVDIREEVLRNVQGQIKKFEINIPEFKRLLTLLDNLSLIEKL